jgi:tRNA (cytidine/uridine-2'-O-)-methyltransferase
MDYWQRLEWEAVDDWEDLVERLPGRSFWYFSKRAERSYCDVQYAPGDVLTFGCESRGLPASLLESHAATALRIPIRPAVRSLNLSNSVAVAAYEVVRQLGWPADADRDAIDSDDATGHD